MYANPRDSWKPLPQDVAEWMGVREVSPPEDPSARVRIPGQRGWRGRLRELSRQYYRA